MADAFSETPEPHEEKVIAYLRNGLCLGARGGYVNDVFDATCKAPLVAHTYTDGTYFWRLDLAHYVGKYHLRLPEDFLRHMASLGWNNPKQQREDEGEPGPDRV
jgi:hypothetical protein